MHTQSNSICTAVFLAPSTSPRNSVHSAKENRAGFVWFFACCRRAWDSSYEERYFLGKGDSAHGLQTPVHHVALVREVAQGGAAWLRRGSAVLQLVCCPLGATAELRGFSELKAGV